MTAHHLLVRGSIGGSFSDRPTSTVASFIVTGQRFHNLNSAPYGPLWRAMRRNITSDVLNPLRLHRFRPARRRALLGLVADLSQQRKSSPNGLVLAAESIRSAMFGLIVSMCFGDGVDEARIRAMADAQNDLIQVFPGMPIFSKHAGSISRIMYRKRWNKLLALRQKQEEMYLPLIDARRSRRRHHSSGEPPAYVDTLIGLGVPVPGEHSQVPSSRRALKDGELVGMCTEFLGAGSEAVAAELQWIMAYIVKRPDMQEAVRREIDAVVGADAEEVTEEVLGKLEYLNAVVLEALRLHPTVPSVFRQVTESDHLILDGRPIPAGTVVVFPPWSVARDKTAWADPDEFKPERFLAGGGGESLSLLAAAGSAGEIRMMPFGAGRRMCPGMGVAVLHLVYFMANLVREFEWREADGELAVDLKPHVAFFTVMGRPLRARLVLRREDKLGG